MTNIERGSNGNEKLTQKIVIKREKKYTKEVYYE